MYCSHCGAWNPQGSKYCARCGQKIQAAEDQRPPQKRPINAAAILVAAAMLLILALLCVGAFMMRDDLGRIWRDLLAPPPQVIVPPTVSPTSVPTRIAFTPTPAVSPSAPPTATALPAATPTPLPTHSPTPIQRTFELVYRQCIPHGLGLGSVKGQIFDRNGRTIPGAKVRITINGYEWQSAANPATSNGEGWYEWVLEVDQKVQFVELIVDGESVPFSSPGFEVKAQGGCFQRVDFVEQ